MIKYYKKTINQEFLEELDEFKVGSWINMINPSQEELEDLARKFKLDIEVLEEGLDQNELPRMDGDENIKYIFVKTPTKKELQLNTLLIVIGPSFLITISQQEFPTLSKILNGKIQVTTTQKLKALITILKNINDELEISVTRIVKHVQTKKSVTTKLGNKDLGSLLLYEDFLNTLASIYNYTGILYSKLAKNLKFYDDDKEDLKDLIIESEEGSHICKIALKTISNITNYYSITLSNDLNKTIKLLTILTIAINIPAAIGGIYGMNINLPLQQNPLAFFYIIGIMVSLIIIFLIFIRKK